MTFTPRPPRDSDGKLLPGGPSLNPGGSGSAKLYSQAVRHLLATSLSQLVPDGWPADRKDWTHAQELAERHMALALSGDTDTAQMLISRAEGKVPMAPEDRASGEEQARLLGGDTALNSLRLALGMQRVMDVQVIDEAPKLEAGARVVGLVLESDDRPTEVVT